MTRLQELHADQNQSPWLDNLNRASLDGGTWGIHSCGD